MPKTMDELKNRIRQIAVVNDYIVDDKAINNIICYFRQRYNNENDFIVNIRLPLMIYGEKETA